MVICFFKVIRGECLLLWTSLTLPFLTSKPSLKVFAWLGQAHQDTLLFDELKSTNEGHLKSPFAFATQCNWKEDGDATRLSRPTHSTHSLREGLYRVYTPGAGIRGPSWKSACHNIYQYSRHSSITRKVYYDAQFPFVSSWSTSGLYPK